MKKSVKGFLLFFSLVLLVAVPFASASLFGDVFSKLSGNAIIGEGSTGTIGAVSSGEEWTQWFDRDGPGGSGIMKFMLNFLGFLFSLWV